jgi:glutathione S-transferase
MSLAHKGLDFESIPWRMTEKDRLHFAESERVPVLVDGDTTLKESWDILQYLDKTYTEKPLDIDRAEVRFVRHWTETVINPALAQMIVDHVWETVHEKDQEYFRNTREKLFGMPLEEFGANKEEKVEAFRKTITPLRLTLEARPFLGGDAPNAADYVVFGSMMWARVTSPLRLLEESDPVYRWQEALLDLYDGMARKTPARA